MFEEELKLTKRIVDVRAVKPNDSAAIWTAAFKLFAALGSRKAGFYAALICGEFADDLGDPYHARAWDSVCGAIREIRKSMFVP